MKSLSLAAALAFCVLLTGGCTPSRKTVEQNNPMPAIWASIVREIETLKQNEATEAQWTKAAEHAKRISTFPQLQAAMAAVGSSNNPEKRAEAETRLKSYFETSHRTLHFGFEGNFHAIVFFDARGRQRFAYNQAK